MKRCRVCEVRAMSDAAAQLPEDAAWEVVSPKGLVHLTEGSGFTFCGHDCAPWECVRP